MDYRTGTVALVGRPNAGKSTLLNQLVGARIAAVSPRPQTTRNRIMGVVTVPGLQAVLVDTPGLHGAKSELNRRMVMAAEAAMAEVDLLCWIVDAFRPHDEELAARFAGKTVVVALNKVDGFADKPKLLPLIAAYAQNGVVVPISALTGEGTDTLLAEWRKALPEGEALYPDDQITDAHERDICAELVREQVFLLCGQEIPYVTAIEIEGFDEARRAEGYVTIHARILVEKQSQKAIVVGAGGKMIKRIGTDARKRIEALLDAKVDLRLFVVVERDWTANPRLLRELGYTGE
ncbi:MAG: GTPase Era [Myxococcales bacterium]|nr:GTPase Era [Myxococcales bacterium]